MIDAAEGEDGFEVEMLRGRWVSIGWRGKCGVGGIGVPRGGRRRECLVGSWWW